MLKNLNILKRFCDAFWEYRIEDQMVYLHYDTMTPEFCEKWTAYNEIFDLYRDQYVYPADLQQWEALLSKEKLDEFYHSDQNEKHFFIRFYFHKQLQWHEVYLEKLENGNLSLSSHDIYKLKRNDAVIKAIDPKFDYVTYINVKDQSYILYSSNENETIIPKQQAENYTQILKEFNETYVVPEEIEYSIRAMSFENVVKQLETKKEYILYVTTSENNQRRYKKLRYCYSDSSKQTILLSRVDITDLIHEQKLRAEEEKKITYYLEQLPIAVCITKVLLDENQQPFDWEFVYSNKAHSKLEGVEYGSLIGKRFYESFKEENAIWLQYYYETAYLGISHTIDEFSSAINKHLIIHTFPTEPGYCGCAIEDITERKFLERELGKSYQELQHILKETTDFVFQYDFKTKCISMVSNEKSFKFDQAVNISEYLQKGYFEEQSVQKLRSAIEKIKNGETHIAVDVLARKDLHSQFCWYRVNLSDYVEIENHQRKILGYVKNIDELVQKQEKLKKEAQHDPLTGILNVKAGKEKILKRISSHQEDYYNALFIMDIDHFKQTNDTLGHMTGDKLLIEFSRILKNTFRAEDVIYRIGGDEFAVFVEKIQNPKETIPLIMERFFHQLEQKKDVMLSSSVGIYYSNVQTSFEEYYAKADKALYKSKQNGRQQYCIYEE